MSRRGAACGCYSEALVCVFEATVRATTPSNSLLAMEKWRSGGSVSAQGARESDTAPSVERAPLRRRRCRGVRVDPLRDGGEGRASVGDTRATASLTECSVAMTSESSSEALRFGCNDSRYVSLGVFGRRRGGGGGGATSCSSDDGDCESSVLRGRNGTVLLRVRRRFNATTSPPCRARTSSSRACASSSCFCSLVRLFSASSSLARRSPSTFSCVSRYASSVAQRSFNRPTSLRSMSVSSAISSMRRRRAAAAASLSAIAARFVSSAALFFASSRASVCICSSTRRPLMLVRYIHPSSITMISSTPPPHSRCITG